MPTGYGTVTIYGKATTAHRAVYELLVAHVPPDFQVHHECENPRCINPAHLQAVLSAQHRQMHEHFVGRPATCKHGHPFDEMNTYFRKTPRGVQRQCRKCKAIRERERQRRLRVTMQEDLMAQLPERTQSTQT